MRTIPSENTLQSPTAIAEQNRPKGQWTSNLLRWSRTWGLPLLAVAYVLLYILIDSFVDTVVRHYIFSIFLVISSLYFSWYLGGKETMLYVTFFNIFFAFIFSRLLYLSGGGLFAKNLFLGRSFLIMYIISVLFMVIMIKRKSPADVERERREQSIQEERNRRRQLELMVATEKLTSDLVRQANLVKDELLLLNGAWKSEIHSIINDLPSVKEKELYEQIVLPFQDSIINHLRELETRLSFSPQQVELKSLYRFLTKKMMNDKIYMDKRIEIDINDLGWEKSNSVVLLDSYKTWEIVRNIIRNSQTAIELTQIKLLNTDIKKYSTFKPHICIEFIKEETFAVFQITDNGGGVPEDTAAQLFKQAVPSVKRGGKQYGQGTIFIKFFGESMGMQIGACNAVLLGAPGLQVTIYIPLEQSITHMKKQGAAS